jgi:hypothetical protein
MMIFVPESHMFVQEFLNPRDFRFWNNVHHGKRIAFGMGTYQSQLVCNRRKGYAKDSY